MAKAEIRLGLVGLGKIARDQHCPAIAADPRFELVATASPEGGVAGTPAYPDLAAMLAGQPRLDAVALCTPPAVRTELARQALEAGLHVLLEKPPGPCVSQVEALAADAATTGRTLFAAWHSRETGAVDLARDWLSARRIDRVAVTWREDVRVWHPGQDWLLAAGGFGVFDPGINALSILTGILPGPLALERARLGIPGNREAPMTATLALRHGHSTPVHCEFSILHEGEQQWDIAIDTDSGRLHLARGGHDLTIDGARRATPETAEYPRLYTRFAQLIDTGRSEVDWRPLTLVGDAFLCGAKEPLPDFRF